MTTAAPDRVRVLIVEPDPTLANALRALIDEDPQLRVVAIAFDAPTGVRYMRALLPDALVVSIPSPGMPPGTLIETARVELGSLVVIVGLVDDEGAEAKLALDRGADVAVSRENFRILLERLRTTERRGVIFG